MNNRNKAIILTSILLLVVALAVFLIGGWLAGWDFAAYFQSQSFVWLCVVLGLYGLSVAAIFAYDKIKRL